MLVSRKSLCVSAALVVVMISPCGVMGQSKPPAKEPRKPAATLPGAGKLELKRNNSAPVKKLDVEMELTDGYFFDDSQQGGTSPPAGCPGRRCVPVADWDAKGLAFVITAKQEASLKGVRVRVLSANGKTLFVSGPVDVPVGKRERLFAFDRKAATAASEYFRQGNYMLMTVDDAQGAESAVAQVGILGRGL